MIYLLQQFFCFTWQHDMFFFLSGHDVFTGFYPLTWLSLNKSCIQTQMRWKSWEICYRKALRLPIRSFKRNSFEPWCVSRCDYLKLYIFFPGLESRERRKIAAGRADMEMAEVKESQQDPTCGRFALKRMRLPQRLTLRIGLIRNDVYRNARVHDWDTYPVTVPKAPRSTLHTHAAGDVLYPFSHTGLTWPCRLRSEAVCCRIKQQPVDGPTLPALTWGLHHTPLNPEAEVGEMGRGGGRKCDGGTVKEWRQRKWKMERVRGRWRKESRCWFTPAVSSPWMSF